MGEYTAKLTKTAAEHLEDGETFVAGRSASLREASDDGRSEVEGSVRSAPWWPARPRTTGHSIAGADLPRPPSPSA